MSMGAASSMCECVSVGENIQNRQSIWLLHGAYNATGVETTYTCVRVYVSEFMCECMKLSDTPTQGTYIDAVVKSVFIWTHTHMQMNIYLSIAFARTTVIFDDTIRKMAVKWNNLLLKAECIVE